MQPIVSIIMLGHRRADLLKFALESILRETKAQNYELLLVLNGANSKVRELAAEYSTVLPLRILVINEERPGAARGFGIRAALGDILLFLDDDIELFQDIVSNTIRLFSDHKVQAAGGPNLTPPKSGALERATGMAMESFFGAATMRLRYKSTEKTFKCDEHGLILCNLAVRRKIFNELSFPRHFVSNEENIILQKMSVSGLNMISSATLAVFHKRRESWRLLIQQNYKYGMGRSQNILYFPESFKFLYIIPSIFLFYLLLAWVFPLPLLIYFLLAIGNSFSSIFCSKDWAALFLPLVYLCIHLSYGAGFFVGWISWLGRRGKLSEVL